MPELRRLGLVIHPSRPLDGVLGALGDWTAANGAELAQVRIEGQTRVVADPIEPGDCDLLIAVGGDGTTLTALHAGAPTGKAVLGIACGSVGVLTSIRAEQTLAALDKVDAGDWTSHDVPGLEVSGGSAGDVAINDLTVIRDGPNQLIVSIVVDGEHYASVAGDGLVVATPLGSSAYTMAAGGPLLAAGAEGVVITPLAPHGGFCPPLVAGLDSHVELTIDPGHGGVRHEIDGRLASFPSEQLSARVRPAYAKLVELAGEEPRLTGLRRRGLIADSPRVLVRDARGDAEPI
jgi:NAD+ kinase